MRRYDDVVDVRSGQVAELGSRWEAPAQFVWRERLWSVCEVVAHWVETGSWWERSEPHQPGDDLAGECEVWRVDAPRDAGHRDPGDVGHLRPQPRLDHEAVAARPVPGLMTRPMTSLAMTDPTNGAVRPGPTGQSVACDHLDRAEAGRTRAVSQRDADDLLRDAETFVRVVEQVLGLTRQRPLDLR